MSDVPSTPAPPPPPNAPTATASYPPHGPPPPPSTRPPRPGELTVAWRIALAIAWAAVFFAFAAVWKTSEELGIGTWWLGPRSTPQPVLVRIIPFVVAVVFGVASTYAMRRVPLLNIGGALVLIAIAVPDFWRSTGLAVIELAIGVAMLLVASSSIAGRYRDVASVEQASDSVRRR